MKMETLEIIYVEFFTVETAYLAIIGLFVISVFDTP